MTEFAPQSKLLHHADRLTAFVEGDYEKAPVQIEISPTNSCNAKCPWCFYVSGEYKQRHSKEEIPAGSLFDALSDMAEMGVHAVTWTGGGDPSTYSMIDEAIDYCADDLGLKQGIFTNAYKPLRSPEKLDWIRVTVTEKFLITKHVAKYAEKTKVGVNFNLCKENEDQMFRMAVEARAAGVKYFQVRPALADRADLQEEVKTPYWLRNQLQTDTFRVVLTEYKWEDYLKPHGYPKCYGHQFVPFLWHNGDLAVCAYHFGKEEFTFGNVVSEGFRSVWTGERRRGMIERGVGVIRECQHCCKLHEVNKALAVVAGDIIEVEDVNFL